MTRSFVPKRAAAPDRPGSPRLLGPAWVLALLALAIAAPPARAGQTLNAKSIFNNNSGLGVTVKYAGQANVNTIAGTFKTYFYTSSSYDNSTAAPGAFAEYTTFCVDIGTYNVSSKVNADVSVTDISPVVDGRGSPRDIGAAGWIFYSYASMTLTQLRGLDVSLSSLTQQEANSAIQMSIWEAAYDSTGKGATGYFSTGPLTFTGAAAGNARVNTLATLMLDARGTSTAKVGFIDYPPIVGGASSPRNQDMLFLTPDSSINAVPEPSTLAMAAVGGLIGLGVLGRKRLGNRATRS